MMRAKEKFKQVFMLLPMNARTGLIYDPFYNPMSLNVCWEEIRHGTKLGKRILDELGFKDD